MEPTPTEPQGHPDPPRPHLAQALVVARWNSWARVWFPDRDETRWVNLAEVGHWRTSPVATEAAATDGED